MGLISESLNVIDVRSERMIYLGNMKVAPMMKVGPFAISDLRCNCDCTERTEDFVLANCGSRAVASDAASPHSFRGHFV